MNKPDGHEESTRLPKVARLIEEYELSGIGDEMEHLWTTDSAEPAETRHVLQSSTLGGTTRGGRCTDAHRRVRAPPPTIDRRRRQRGGSIADVSSTRTGGVDVESYLADTVSYQAIRTYLREHRGAEYSGPSEDPTSATATSIRRLRGRTASVTRANLRGSSRPVTSIRNRFTSSSRAASSVSGVEADTRPERSQSAADAATRRQ